MASRRRMDEQVVLRMPEGERSVGGSLDAVNGRVVEGWALDYSDPGNAVLVEIYDRERRIGEAVAGQFREDLLEAGIGDGCHAFRYLLPLEIFDGSEHAIIVCIGGSRMLLHNTPYLLRTEQLPVQQSFPTTRPVVNATPPLSDMQFTMLRGMHAIVDALTVQNRALEALVSQITTPHPIVIEPPPPPPTEEERFGPLLAAARQHPRGVHDIVVFSIIDWDFRIQRPQHLATQLAALGSRVFYLSVSFADAAISTPFVIRAQPVEGVFEIALSCRAPVPNIYAGIEDEAQLEDIITSLATMLDQIGVRAPVGIVQFPAWYPVAISVPGMVLLHDCLDHVAGFNNIAPRIVALENTLIEQADCVVVTSEFLADFVGRRRPAEMVRNGVETAYFSRPPATPFAPEARPVIGYYGAIADWFDMKLVLHCARRHPEWRFVLIGATEGADCAAARKLDNIEFLGEKPYRELTHYLYAFDVCIIPFKLVELIQATNPVKIYEYLCAGKPVVATDMPELRLLPPDLVEIAKSPAEFERRIAGLLTGDTAQHAAQRREWAMQQSWRVRGRALQAVIARQSPRVSVVILCYNNLDFTRACLTSVLRQSEYPDLEIICVDNASDDGTSEFLQDMADRHGSIRHIRNPRNLGFAAGNNIGIRAATGDIVVLLNNDTYVTRGWVRDLVRPLRLDPTIGMTGPLTNMIGNEQKIAIHYATMEEMARRAAAFTALRRRERLEVTTLAFFCIAIRRDVLDKAGLLDESYTVGFFEDDDYCAAARQAGFRLAICDDVFVHHHLSASFSQLERSEKAELMRRNRRIFEKKWGKWTPHRYRDAPGFGE